MLKVAVFKTWLSKKLTFSLGQTILSIFISLLEISLDPFSTHLHKSYASFGLEYDILYLMLQFRRCCDVYHDFDVHAIRMRQQWSPRQ